MAHIGFVPPGLQELLPVSQFYIHQTWNGMFQGYCTYNLSGPNGQLVYQATEDRECCGPRLSVRVQNIQGYNVLNLYIPANFCSWETTLQVSDSSGQILGYVDQNWTAFSSSFDILNPHHEICLKVKGPGWGEGFMSDQVHQVLSADKSFSVGQITRVWRGLLCRDDKFVLQFPPDLDVSMKALLISCTLLIDLLQHERNRKSN
ncbi:phospholipid scramblase 3-like [Bufo bufo]|uniref:phospholipid scramblase 3-like n=1 Tax=Bufo bufo TaxID=8384 RepID=UPI001ABD9FE5|nr:phospholipid scramblase 3-like [Bufo bufo]